MNRPLVFLAALAVALAACAPAPARTPSNELRMVRQFRAISLERAGQYGPYSITVPAYTAQEFVLTANPEKVEKYTVQVRGAQGGVGVYVCAGRPCIGFAGTADWKDLGESATKGPEIRVNGTKPDYVYVLNNTASPKAFSLTATAK